MKVQHFGLRHFDEVWSEMNTFSRARTAETEDQIWFLEHFPVYTQGTSCHDLPFDNPENIPVIHTDRGGKMTYHGPGQLIVYLLMDIKRLGSGPKSFVKNIESIIIDALGHFDIKAGRMSGAPGVYVDSNKIGALGLRITQGCCYHGFSINVNMDLAPFENIIPCGLEDVQITQIADYKPEISVDKVSKVVEQALEHQFSI